MQSLQSSQENALEQREESDIEEEAAVAEFETDFRPSSPVSFSGEAFYRAPVAPSQLLVRRMLCKLSPQLKPTV